MNKLYSLFVCLVVRFLVERVGKSANLPRVKRSRVSLSFLLPLLELVIWLFIIPIPTTLLYLGVQASRQDTGDVVVSTKNGTIRGSQSAMRRIALEGPAMRASHAITALNIPATVVEIPISLLASWPANLPSDVWRSFTLPFFCLPAWWFVGRGLDSLWGKKKLRWPITLIGTVLFVGFVILFCGLRFGVSSSEHGDVSWPLWGMGLWAISFSVFPLAWLVCRRTLVPE
jgi:hypothetical protein